MLIKSNKLLFLLLTGIIYSSCTTYKPFYAKGETDWEKANNPDTLTLDYTVFLAGDAGKPSITYKEPTFRLLESQMYKFDTLKVDGKDSIVRYSDPKDVVIFLGDNIYESGLPELGVADRPEMEKRMIEQLKVVKEFKGKRIFMPGNHDWNQGRPGGLAAIKRQEEFVENYLDSTDVFMPSNGCSGPVEIQMNKNLVIIVLDSEWWLHKFSKSTRYDGCPNTTREQIITQVKDILLRNKGKNILFTQHHPLFSNGKHGGYFTFLEYLFPLTLVRDNLYIPLPGIGSLYPLLRQYGLSRQDISNKDYQQLRSSLLALFKDEDNIVMATGHEHALQFTKYENLNHIISGSGSKKSSLFKGNDALFGHGTKGFARINYYTNGQSWVEFWEPNEDGSKGKLMYRKPLYALPISKAIVKKENLIDYKDSVKLVAVGARYKASPLKQKIFGEHYRSVWATPIQIPYLDLTTFAGGLTPLQLGGGNQTTSLRMVGKDGIQYQFRTVDKDPGAVLPMGLQNTFADDFVQDQISSSHPFGALVIPGLAKASGIYHTQPKLFYMPYSTLLGPYLSEIGGKIGMLEIRPDENLSKFPNFGRTKNAVGTDKVYEKIKEDNDNEVDQESFLKARLFDMIIGDWDRHEDQWRWAEFEKKKGAIYKPIPRDRDQVFTKFDGLIPKIAQSLLPDIQHFTDGIDNPAEFSLAARNLDRNFLNELSEEQWNKIANQLKADLTDKVIEDAVKDMPKEAYQISGEEIITKLKSRRDVIDKAANSYYKTLAKEVTIAGSDKYEYVEIHRNKENTEVKIFKIKKEGTIDTLTYWRLFDNSLTKELNIYLLGENDSLIIKGRSDNPLKIRVIGGGQKDIIKDESENGKAVIYDNPGNDITGGSGTRIVLSTKPWVNAYAVNSFTYDKAGIGPAIDYPNGADGIMIGLSHTIKRYGFRKSPYSFEQKIAALYAFKSTAIDIRYTSIFHSLFYHKYDLVLTGNFAGPAYSFNYYGIGNSTENIDDNIDFYRVRSRLLTASAFFQYRHSDRTTMGIGPGFDYFDILKWDPNTIVGSLQENFDNPGKFASIKSYLNIDFTNRPINPQTGFKWQNSINFYQQIDAEKDRYAQLSTNFSGYATPNIAFPITFALRLGGQTNIGDFKFYQANTIGNNQNLRGFRTNRFSGRTSYYANTELRFPVTRFRNYIVTGDFGLYGFHDIARVKSNRPEDNNWHQGYGPGLWINFYDKVLLTLGYGFSKESRLFSFNTGFRF